MTNILNKKPLSFRISRKKDRNLKMPDDIGHYLLGSITIYLGQLLGTGGFGSVYTVFDFHTQEKAAAKIISIKGRSQDLQKKI